MARSIREMVGNEVSEGVFQWGWYTRRWWLHHKLAWPEVSDNSSPVVCTPEGGVQPSCDIYFVPRHAGNPNLEKYFPIFFQLAARIRDRTLAVLTDETHMAVPVLSCRLVRLMCVTKEGLTFGDEDAGEVKRREKHYKEAYKPLTDFLKDALKGKINKVLTTAHRQVTLLSFREKITMRTYK